MKKIKLLLTVPALTSAFIPLVSCGDPKSNIEIKIQSEKSITSKTHITYFHFTLSKEVSKDKIEFKTINETQPACGIYSKYLQVDGTDLYLYIVFDSQDSTGKYSFDLEFTIDNVKIKFEGLSATFAPDETYLPRQALVIEDGVLKGLNSEFKTSEVYTYLFIPEDVTSIAENAFKDAFSKTSTDYKIRYISLPSELTSIGANAFAGCNNIETLSVSRLPVSTEQSPITIGTDAFKSWADSGEIVYADDAKSYELLDYQLIDNGLNKAWFKTDGVIRKMPTSDFVIEGTTLKSVNWSPSEIPAHLQLVNQIIIPDTIEDIAEDAFFDSTTIKTKLTDNIDTIKWPSKLKTIGNNAFYWCPFKYFINDGEATIDCNFPSTLTSIGEYAFKNAKNIECVTFHKNLATIGQKAFAECSNLTYIYVNELDSVPAGWSTNDTFVNPASIGGVNCKPAVASDWKDYFHDCGIDFNDWTISEDINLLNEYEPSTQPKAEVTYSKSDIKTTAKAYCNDIQDSAILVDDLAFTLQDHLNDLFETFKVKFLYTSCGGGFVSVNIWYEAKPKDDTETYIGVWSFERLLINDTSCKAIEAIEGKYFQFAFENLFNWESVYLPTTITIRECKASDLSTLTVDNEFTNDLEVTDLTADTLGVPLSMLGLFAKDGNKLQLTINSHYWKNCKLV